MYIYQTPRRRRAEGHWPRRTLAKTKSGDYSGLAQSGQSGLDRPSYCRLQRCRQRVGGWITSSSRCRSETSRPSVGPLISSRSTTSGASQMRLRSRHILHPYARAGCRVRAVQRSRTRSRVLLRRRTLVLVSDIATFQLTTEKAIVRRDRENISWKRYAVAPIVVTSSWLAPPAEDEYEAQCAAASSKCLSRRSAMPPLSRARACFMIARVQVP